MVNKFQSPYKTLLGYPAPTEKWTDADLWEWVDAGKPGNPPWNPEGLKVGNFAAQQVIIDASGNREVYELYKKGKPGSVKASLVANRESRYQTALDLDPKAGRARMLKIAAVIGGVTLLAIFGMGS